MPLNYYFATGFMEGAKRVLPFGKKVHVMHLKSIAIVCNDDRTYIYNGTDKTYDTIAKEITDFVCEPIKEDRFDVVLNKGKYKKKGENGAYLLRNYKIKQGAELPDFYGYYCEHDWVMLCALFGGIRFIPDVFPKFSFDLKQTMELFGYNQAWKDQFHPQPDQANVLEEAQWIHELHKKIYVHAKIKINNLKF